MYADSTAIVYTSDNTHDGNTSINGELTVKGKLNLKQTASDGTSSDIIEYLDIARLSKINHLINYTASGTQTVITAGDGSTIGGVGFTAGALTGVKSINADDSNSKFSVDENGAIRVAGGKVRTEEDQKKFTFKAGNLLITTDKNASGQLYQNITFSDYNSTGYEITLAEIVNTRNRTKAVETGYDSDNNVKDTFTSIEDKLKVYDKHSVYDNSTGTWSNTSLDLVTIKGDLSVDSNNGSRIVTEDNSKFYIKGSDGSLKAADGKFKVDAKGAITAAGNKFYVKEDGKVQIEDELVISHAGSNTEADPGKSATLNIDNLTAINKLIKVTDGVNPTVVYDTDGKPLITAGDGSTIGGVTISGGQLSVSQGTVNVTDLVKDHELVNDDYKGNERLNSRINSLEQSSTTLGSQIQKIERFTNQKNNKEGTSIAGNLDVYDDGTVIINDNDDKVATVTIDSNRISIGNVSLIENDYVKNDGTIHYNQTINDYAKLDVKKGKIGYKVGNYSVTTSSATATGDYDVDQANKGTVFSNDTNYTRIDGSEINSVNGKNTGVLDGSWLELTHENGSKAVLRQGGLILTDENGYETKLEGGVLSYGPSNDIKSISVSDLVNAQGVASTVDTKTAGIARDTTGTPTTTIENTLKVSSDGTVKINEGDDQQVIIDSNGIKVGLGSAYINNDGFKAGADGKNSLTTSGLTAKTIKAGTNNDEFVVNENGNLVSKGTLSAANGAFSVGISGDVITSGSVKLNSGANSTQLTAGGVSFTKDGKTTTIAGDTVTVSSSTGDKSFNLSDIADVGQNMTNLGNRIDNVNTRVDGVAQDVTNLSNRVGTVESSINDVKNSVDSVKQDVTNLGNRVDNVETSISNVNTRIDGVEQDITNVKNSVAQINTDFSQVSGRIDNVETNINEVKSSVTTIDTKLGKLDDLDADDVKGHEKYSSNQSVVGAINAEAAVRKEAIADEAAARQADVARLDGRISDVSSRINKVGAMAAAISSLKTMGYDPESPTEFSVGLGQYKGETGVALGFFHYPNKNFMINVSLSTSSGEIMGGIGATWRFGHKSPQKLLEEQRAAHAEKEIAAAEAYKAARAAKQTK